MSQQRAPSRRCCTSTRMASRRHYHSRSRQERATWDMSLAPFAAVRVITPIEWPPVVKLCPYCKTMMMPTKRGPQSLRRMTSDHIFPRQWGGTNESENIRSCCQACNSLRAAVGHCVGCPGVRLAHRQGNTARPWLRRARLAHVLHCLANKGTQAMTRAELQAFHRMNRAMDHMLRTARTASIAWKGIDRIAPPGNAFHPMTARRARRHWPRWLLALVALGALL